VRTVLLDENRQSPHWSASAYLFCSRIEQNSLGLTSQPVIDRISAEGGTVQLFQSISVVIGDIKAQQEYLTAFIEGTMNDEFITRAIEKNRYVKTLRLIDRFEVDTLRWHIRAVHLAR
jgi:hypothetical protein